MKLSKDEWREAWQWVEDHNISTMFGLIMFHGKLDGDLYEIKVARSPYTESTEMNWAAEMSERYSDDV